MCITQLKAQSAIQSQLMAGMCTAVKCTVLIDLSDCGCEIRVQRWKLIQLLLLPLFCKYKYLLLDYKRKFLLFLVNLCKAFAYVTLLARQSLPCNVTRWASKIHQDEHHQLLFVLIPEVSHFFTSASWQISLSTLDNHFLSFPRLVSPATLLFRLGLRNRLSHKNNMSGRINAQPPAPAPQTLIPTSKSWCLFLTTTSVMVIEQSLCPVAT